MEKKDSDTKSTTKLDIRLYEVSNYGLGLLDTGDLVECVVLCKEGKYYLTFHPTDKGGYCTSISVCTENKNGHLVPLMPSDLWFNIYSRKDLQKILATLAEADKRFETVVTKAEERSNLKPKTVAVVKQ